MTGSPAPNGSTHTGGYANDRDPALRMAKSGKPFAAALIRTESGDETIWANIAVFDEIPQAELPRLKAGEAVSIQGALKVSVFEKSGEHRANLNVTAWHVMGLRQPRREKPKMPAVETGGPYRNPPPGCTAANPEFDDPMPW
jgi:Single-strand binding protein family